MRLNDSTLTYHGDVLRGAYVVRSDVFEDVYPDSVRAGFGEYLTIDERPLQSNEILSRPEILEDVNVLVGSWGIPNLSESLLSAMPNLRLVLYGAGSIRSVTSDAFWNRGIPISSAWEANGIPVSEFTLGAILLSLKHVWRASREVKEARSFGVSRHSPGNFGSTVGLLSLGVIGRLTLERLRGFDVKILACDPLVSPEEVRSLGAIPVGLDQLFEESDVVSVHTPWLPETEQMLRGHHFERMKQGATLINTARGAIIHEPELIEVLLRRPDLQALLDVTYPEPPVPGSELYDLPNVVLTPHIAGAIDRECGRLGQLMLEELQRFLRHEPLRYVISRERAAVLA